MGLFDFVGNIAGGLLGFAGARSNQNAVGDANANNAALQREFAQQGVRWRVEDAKKAGIHPLFALGAQVTPASPSFVGDTSMGSAMASMGQDLSRAMHSTRTRGERLTSQMEGLQLERASLENELIRSQIAGSKMAILNQAGGNPPLPTLDDSGRVDVLDSKRTSTMPFDSSTEAAVSPANKAFINRDGSVVMWPSADAKQSIEDTPYEWEHVWRNRVAPFFSGLADRFLERVYIEPYERRTGRRSDMRN